MNRGESIPTRESLLGRLKDWGDDASWQEFFDTYWRLIYNVSVKAGLNDSEAQEVVQETVISVARNIGKFRYDPKVCSFKTWMLRATRWRILNQFKQRAQTPSAPHRSGSVGNETATLEKIADPASLEMNRVWEEEWSRALYDRAVEAVKQRVHPYQFQIFDLYVMQNVPVRIVARTLRVSPARVYLAKHRVAAQIRKEVRRLEKQIPS